MKLKWLSNAINALLFAALSLALTAAIGTAVKRAPFLMTAVMSNSMYPEFERGDMLLIANLSAAAPVEKGDIIVFRMQEGKLRDNWVTHRIMSGDAASGYITQGDANQYTDQNLDDNPPVAREWIEGRVIELGGHALKLPLLGYLPLWMKEFQKSPYALPGILVFLVVAVFLVIGKKEKGGKSGRKKSAGIAAAYFFSGLILSIMLGASMVALSQHLTFVYKVSAHEQGVMANSDVGILRLGETLERPLAELTNTGFFPVIASITSNDTQFAPSHHSLLLAPGNEVDVTLKVEANQEGDYTSVVHVGIFYPFLFRDILYRLASVDYFLAVAVTALIPGLPLMLCPLFDPRLRRAVSSGFRRALAG